MTTKTLSSNNRYLKRSSAVKSIVTNVSSSTAIETGKPTSTYVSRGAKSGRSAVASSPTPPKK